MENLLLGIVKEWEMFKYSTWQRRKKASREISPTSCDLEFLGKNTSETIGFCLVS